MHLQVEIVRLDSCEARLSWPVIAVIHYARRQVRPQEVDHILFPRLVLLFLQIRPLLWWPLAS